jgi:hypothetical protein
LDAADAEERERRQWMSWKESTSERKTQSCSWLKMPGMWESAMSVDLSLWTPESHIRWVGVSGFNFLAMELERKIGVG